MGSQCNDAGPFCHSNGRRPADQTPIRTSYSAVILPGGRHRHDGSIFQPGWRGLLDNWFSPVSTCKAHDRPASDFNLGPCLRGWKTVATVGKEVWRRSQRNRWYLPRNFGNTGKWSFQFGFAVTGRWQMHLRRRSGFLWKQRGLLTKLLMQKYQKQITGYDVDCYMHVQINITTDLTGGAAYRINDNLRYMAD